MSNKRDATEITDEMIADLRKRIGVVWKPWRPYFNTAATKDSIRHFCEGIGDFNPLFINPDYAKNTSYSCVIAPPLFFYSIYYAAAGRGMPGVHSWHSGDDWEFHQPIIEGDTFTYENEMVDVQVKKSKMAGKSVIQYHEIRYFNQRDELAAKSLNWCIRSARKASADKRKYAGIKQATYSVEEMQKIYDSYDSEEIRGATPRYWEDCKIGDELKPVVKGPLSKRDIFAWLKGAGSVFIEAHGYALAFLRRHGELEMVDEKTGLPDVPELVHMEDTRAQTIGLPSAYDYGCQRISWLGNLLTNWMGDDGFIKRLRAELRRFNIIGDTTWLKGKVIEKYEKDGEFLVDIDCWGENQRGEITMPGIATVRLPSKIGKVRRN